jgi:TolA-binding protein
MAQSVAMGGAFPAAVTVIGAGVAGLGAAAAGARCERKLKDKRSRERRRRRRMERASICPGQKLSELRQRLRQLRQTLRQLRRRLLQKGEARRRECKSERVEGEQKRRGEKNVFGTKYEKA